MSEIIEREEGLFTRHGATRALCIIAMAGWAAVATMALMFAAVAFRPGDTPLAGVDRFFVLALYVFAVALVSIGVLWLWRKCDRCRRRLFAEGRSHLYLSNLRKTENRSWLRGMWWADALVEPERHYSAKTFLGSYRNGAIFQMALTGRLHCQWCGHEDGKKPSYVVNTPP